MHLCTNRSYKVVQRLSYHSNVRLFSHEDNIHNDNLKPSLLKAYQECTGVQSDPHSVTVGPGTVLNLGIYSVHAPVHSFVQYPLVSKANTVQMRNAYIIGNTALQRVRLPPCLIKEAIIIVILFGLMTIFNDFCFRVYFCET